jgi:hypothetical protein
VVVGGGGAVVALREGVDVASQSPVPPVVRAVSARSYRAVVEFTAANGATIRFTSSVSSNPRPAQVGDHVDVRYNPDNPQDAAINTYWQT